MSRQNNLVKQCRKEQVFGEKYSLGAVFIVSCIINAVLKFKDSPRCASSSPPASGVTLSSFFWNIQVNLSLSMKVSALQTTFFFSRWAQKDPEAMNQRQKLSHSTCQRNGSPCKMMLSNAKPNLKTGCLQWESPADGVDTYCILLHYTHFFLLSIHLLVVFSISSCVIWCIGSMNTRVMSWNASFCPTDNPKLIQFTLLLRLIFSCYQLKPVSFWHSVAWKIKIVAYESDRSLQLYCIREVKEAVPLPVFCVLSSARNFSFLNTGMATISISPVWPWHPFWRVADKCEATQMLHAENSKFSSSLHNTEYLISKSKLVLLASPELNYLCSWNIFVQIKSVFLPQAGLKKHWFRFFFLRASPTHHMVEKMKRVISNCIVSSQVTPYSHNNPDLPNMGLHSDNFCPLCAVKERKGESHFNSLIPKRKNKAGVKVERIMLWVI